jgi:hypothetical protein
MEHGPAPQLWVSWRWGPSCFPLLAPPEPRASGVEGRQLGHVESRMGQARGGSQRNRLSYRQWPHRNPYPGRDWLGDHTALIRELFRNTIQAATILKVDDAFRAKLQATVAKLPPFKIGRNGELQEWYH